MKYVCGNIKFLLYKDNNLPQFSIINKISVRNEVGGGEGETYKTAR